MSWNPLNKISRRSLFEQRRNSCGRRSVAAGAGRCFAGEAIGWANDLRVHRRAADRQLQGHVHHHLRVANVPEVKRAMEEASRHYVHLDELMDGRGSSGWRN